MFWHASESHLRDVYKAFQKNYITGSVSHKSFIQIDKYSFPDERIVYQSFYGASLTFSYFYLSLRKLCVSAPVSKMLAWTVFPYDEKIFQFCLLHEDGIVEACIPGSISQKSVIFYLTAK